MHTAKEVTRDTRFDVVATLRPPQPTVPDSAFSVSEYAARFRLNRNSAMRELSDMVHRGALETAVTNRNGKSTRLYWPKEAQDANETPVVERKSRVGNLRPSRMGPAGVRTPAA